VGGGAERGLGDVRGCVGGGAVGGGDGLGVVSGGVGWRRAGLARDPLSRWSGVRAAVRSRGLWGAAVGGRGAAGSLVAERARVGGAALGSVGRALEGLAGVWEEGSVGGGVARGGWWCGVGVRRGLGVVRRGG
jgi:hypothetical protein